jgi:hypothetical protein
VSEPPIVTLTRWEQSGALWRTRQLGETLAIVDLCSCTGEPMQQLRSQDPELLRYLAARPSSDAEGD